MPAMGDSEYRRRLVARVEALRKEARIPALRFRQQIGPVAARNWMEFVTANDEYAWNLFSLKAMDRIATLFDIDTSKLLSFRSGRI